MKLQGKTPKDTEPYSRTMQHIWKKCNQDFELIKIETLKIILHQFHIWLSEKGLQCIKTKKHPGHLAELTQINTIMWNIGF